MSKQKRPGPKPQHDAPPPVVTDKDLRGKERSVCPGKKDSDAPDGVSGKWS